LFIRETLNNISFEQKVLDFIKANSLLSGRDRVLVGFSGGPDSLALLHVLNKICKKLNVSLSSAHLNHMIRGNEAAKDEKNASNVCKRLGIPLKIKKINVPLKAKKEKLSLEDAARRARYEFFQEASKEFKANKIALGHNSDDNVETSLMRLITGTGTRGLLGIPVKRGKIVRPLLNCSRHEIESYCKKHKLKPRIDKSNFDTKYLRNKIRHKLVPILESINPKAKTAIANMTKLLGADYGYLMDISIKALHGATIKKSKGMLTLDIDKLLLYPDSIRRYVIRAAIEEIKGSLENISYIHIEDIISKLPDGKRWQLHLPSGIFASGNGDTLEISSFNPLQKEEVSFKYNLKIPGSVNIKETGKKIIAKIIARPIKLKIKDKNIALLDLEKTGKNILIRSRKIGDRFSPFGPGGMKKIKDFLINEKISPDKKGVIPILESRGKIIWVAGMRIDNRFKIANTTKKAVKFTYSNQ